MPHGRARRRRSSPARPEPMRVGVAWQAGRRRRRASGRAGEAFIFVTQFPLIELIRGVSVNSCDELIEGVSVNSRDFWLSVSVSPAAGGGVTPRCRRLLLFWPPPIRQILPSRLSSLGEVHHFPAAQVFPAPPPASTRDGRVGLRNASPLWASPAQVKTGDYVFGECRCWHDYSLVNL